MIELIGGIVIGIISVLGIHRATKKETEVT